MSALEVKGTSAAIVGDHIEVVIRVHNQSDRTHYAYSNVRTFHWDSASRTLKIYLADSALSAKMRDHPHLKLPHMQTLAPNEDAEIKVSLPVEFSRMSGDSLRIEQVSMQDVQTVEVELAFSDTPFYHKVGGKPLGHQLIQWAGKSRIKQKIPIAHPANR